MDKWHETEVSSWAMDVTDSIVNKGRQERDAKAAYAKAKRQHRFRKSFIGRIWYGIGNLILLGIGLFFLYVAVMIGIAILQFLGYL